MQALKGQGNERFRNHLDSAGGKYLTNQDVINTGAAWRLANPNTLFASQERHGDIYRQSHEAIKTLDQLAWLS
jgi:hypothetical protein